MQILMYKRQLQKKKDNGPYLCLVGRVPNDTSKRLAKFEELLFSLSSRNYFAIDQPPLDLTPGLDLQSYAHGAFCITSSVIFSLS